MRAACQNFGVPLIFWNIEKASWLLRTRTELPEDSSLPFWKTTYTYLTSLKTNAMYDFTDFSAWNINAPWHLSHHCNQNWFLFLCPLAIYYKGVRIWTKWYNTPKTTAWFVMPMHTSRIEMKKSWNWISRSLELINM